MVKKMNITYKKDLDNKDYYNMLDLWNNEVGNIYPYNLGSFEYNVVNYKERCGMAAYDGEKLIGFIIIKEFHDDYLTGYNDNVFVHLFYVARKYRKNGIGTALINYAKDYAKNRVMWFGKEIGNFAPGVPNDFDNCTDQFLAKRGCTLNGYTHDMLLRNPKTLELNNKNIEYKICDELLLPKMIQMIENNGWKRWAYEAKQEFINDKNNKCYVIGLDNGKVISFAKANTLSYGRNSYNMMWKDRFDNLGGIGPLGVDKEYRKMHLGGDVVKQAINELVKYGVSDIMIDWTGLTQFYQLYGFEVFKTYRYINYDINQDTNK